MRLRLPGLSDGRAEHHAPDEGPQLPARALVFVTYASLAGGLYVLLGVVAGSAQGLTPLVLLVAAALFALAVATHVEGASLHPDRGGSPAYARRAFDELVSFVAAWVLVLDYLLLLAAATLAFTNYLAAFWAPLGSGWPELAVAVGLLAFVAASAIRGYGPRRAARVGLLTSVDIAVQAVVVIVGFAVLSSGAALTDTVSFSGAPPITDALFGLGVALVVITGLESAAALAGEVRIGRRGLRAVAGVLPFSMLLLWPTTAVVGLLALPVGDEGTELGTRYVDAPMLGLVEQLPQDALRPVLVVLVAGLGSLTLIAFAGSAMLGLARTTARMARHRQLPTRVARLDERYGTPRPMILVATVLAILLVLPRDITFLAGAMAFGVLLATTIAHVSVVRLRWTEPRQPRPFRMPLNLPVGPGGLPVPAVLGAVLSAGAWGTIVVFHPGARWLGLGWLAAGVTAYVLYRRSRGLPVRGQVVVPDSALRRPAEPRKLGSILVPILGTALDDDIVQTAGRLAGGDDETDLEDDDAAVIEAVWFHVMPMAEALDGPLPRERADAAKAALARARAVGEEYVGVRVATAAVRSRGAGRSIVEEAGRRGVESIVMAADAARARSRSHTHLGASGGRGQVVSGVTRYVLEHAPCPVILTAPGPDEELHRRSTATGPRPGTDAEEDEDERWLDSL